MEQKINQAFGQVEATKPLERTSVLQCAWPTWS